MRQHGIRIALGAKGLQRPIAGSDPDQIAPLNADLVTAINDPTATNKTAPQAKEVFMAAQLVHGAPAVHRMKIAVS